MKILCTHRKDYKNAAYDDWYVDEDDDTDEDDSNPKLDEHGNPIPKKSKHLGQPPLDFWRKDMAGNYLPKDQQLALEMAARFSSTGMAITGENIASAGSSSMVGANPGGWFQDPLGNWHQAPAGTEAQQQQQQINPNQLQNPYSNNSTNANNQQQNAMGVNTNSTTAATNPNDPANWDPTNPAFWAGAQQALANANGWNDPNQHANGGVNIGQKIPAAPSSSSTNMLIKNAANPDQQSPASKLRAKQERQALKEKIKAFQKSHKKINYWHKAFKMYRFFHDLDLYTRDDTQFSFVKAAWSRQRGMALFANQVWSLEEIKKEYKLVGNTWEYRDSDSEKSDDETEDDSSDTSSGSDSDDSKTLEAGERTARRKKRELKRKKREERRKKTQQQTNGSTNNLADENKNPFDEAEEKKGELATGEAIKEPTGKNVQKATNPVAERKKKVQDLLEEKWNEVKQITIYRQKREEKERRKRQEEIEAQRQKEEADRIARRNRILNAGTSAAPGEFLGQNNNLSEGNNNTGSNLFEAFKSSTTNAMMPECDTFFTKKQLKKMEKDAKKADKLRFKNRPRVVFTPNVIYQRILTETDGYIVDGAPCENPENTHRQLGDDAIKNRLIIKDCHYLDDIENKKILFWNWRGKWYQNFDTPARIKREKFREVKRYFFSNPTRFFHFLTHFKVFFFLFFGPF